MCGICGEFYFRAQGKADLKKIQAMTRLLKHRGPDQEGFFSSADERLAFGHCRLKVIDLATGDQPMMNEDGSIVIVFNGEIYNFQELRAELESKGHRFKTRSDTEVIIHLYEQEGVEGFRNLVGMFAFALWDEKNQRLILARDPFGIKPLFYFQDSSRLIFGSELKALIKGIGRLPDLNPESIFSYLMLQYVPGPKTIFSGIKKLLPGTFFIADPSGVRLGEFFKLSVSSPEKKPAEAQAVEEIRFLLEQSVKSQLIADVPLGAFLSGGIDSSVIVSLMKRIKGRGVKTFSVDFSALGGADDVNETFWSRFASEYFQTEHYQLCVSADDAINCLDKVVSHLDEPVADPACIPTYLISQLARKEVTVVLSGEGADELFGGYLRYRLERLTSLLSLFTFQPGVRLLEKIFSGVPGSRRIRKALRAMQEKRNSERHLLWASVFSPNQTQELLSGSGQLFEKLNERFCAFFAQDSDHINQMLWADFGTWLADDLLVKVDRMSMAHSLEARVPYLDHRLVQYVFTLPGTWKIGFFSGKKIFKRSAKGLIPDSIIARQKAGFTLPLGKWFRQELKGLILERLSESELRQAGLFDSKPVLRLLSEHLSGKEDNSQQLYSILLLQLWRDKIKNWAE